MQTNDQCRGDYFAMKIKGSRLEVFLEKALLKICIKFTGELPCRSVILIKLLSNFIEIKLRHECSPANLLHISRTLFIKNTFGWLLPENMYKLVECSNNLKLIAFVILDTSESDLWWKVSETPWYSWTELR